MAACEICHQDVESHRYIRAEPMRVEERTGRERAIPLEGKTKDTVSSFYCLRHGLGEIAARIEQTYPPSASMAVRLLWSPAPGVRTTHAFDFDNAAFAASKKIQCSRCGEAPEHRMHADHSPLIREVKTRDGHHGCRSVVVKDATALQQAIPLLAPIGTRWYVAHSGAGSAQDAAATIERLLGGDDPLAKQLRRKLADIEPGKELIRG